VVSLGRQEVIGIDESWMIIDEPYICEKCKGVFMKTRPDAVAIKEAKDIFPDLENHPISIICEDCHIEFMKWYNENFKNRILN